MVKFNQLVEEVKENKETINQMNETNFPFVSLMNELNEDE